MRRPKTPTTAPWRIDPDDGLLPGARVSLSPNRDARPEGQPPELLVIHGISLPPGEFGGPWVEQLFHNELPADGHPYFATIAGLKVSAHLFVRRDGEVIQFVPFGERAWHAGASSWRGRERCNDFSIGIELEGCDDRPFEDRQYRRLAEVAGLLLRAYPAITPARIVGHSDVAPGRKTDPGPCFDWLRFHAELEALA